MQPALQPLLSAVQRNCHISDARHAGNYTLCIYLLKMREYFRWEQGYSFRQSLPEGEVGDWLKQRELFWESIEDESFAELPLGGKSIDPFDSEAVNSTVNPHGLVYSAGLGNQGVPHFFLGSLRHHETQPDFTVLVSEDEYARDLTAPPAMALDGTIYVRRQSLRRMIWERVEEWRWHRLDNAMSRAIRGFDFDQDIDAALDGMTDAVVDSVLLHEKGEVLAGKRLGPDWARMLSGLTRSRTEFMLRAVRDLLADALTTLPALLESGNQAALHFYFANLGGMQKHLFPALVEAYETWAGGGSPAAIESLLARGEEHWGQLAGEALEVYRQHPDDFSERVQDLIENRRL